MSERETWATRTGFIFAAVGSAVGLGNIWRFPFAVGEGGGAAFLLVYLLFIALIGFPAILVEFVIGRRTNLNPVGALQSLATGPWRYIGYLFLVTGFAIMAYYSVVAGWFVRYFVIGITDGYTVADPEAAGALFGSIATGLDSLLYHTIFMAAVIGVVAVGIRDGIEKAVKFMVPAIIVLLLVLTVYGATLSDAGLAYEYYLSPDSGVIIDQWQTLLPLAAGQAFFTLSLGMGVMITYASYLGEDRNLVKDALTIIGFDTGIAVLVGFAVFPIIITGAGIEAAGEETVNAIFVSLAAAFSDITGGRILGLLFFGTVALAALSSAISILEVVVSYIIDQFDVDRRPATAIAGGGIFLLGIPVTQDLIFLDLLDGFVNGILLVLGALLLVLLVGWMIPDAGRDELAKGITDIGKRGDIWLWLVRIPLVVVLVVTLALGIEGYFEFLTGSFSEWLAS